MINLLKSYDKKQYSLFAKKIQKKLSKIIKEDTELNLFSITYRAKDIESLEKKVKNKNLENLDFIKDLAGCRIIFYYNDDVEKFHNSNNIYNIFEQIESPIYHNRISDKMDEANELYTAIHYLVQLKESDLLLPEYKDFKNFKCEIQVQTLLNHAYSETIHNITYKKPENSILAEKRLNELDQELKNLMEEHLFPAGYKLDKVRKEHERLIKANDLANDIIGKIKTTSDNSKLYDVLDDYKNNLAEYNNYQSIQDIVIKIVDLSIKKAKEYGEDHCIEILDKLTEILVFTMPLNIDILFPKIIEIYQNEIKEEYLEKIKAHIPKITGYNKYQMENNDYQIQTYILDYVAKWDDKMLIRMFDFVCLLCRPIFQTEITEYNNYQMINYEEPSKTKYSVQMSPIGWISLPKEVEKLRVDTVIFLIKIYSIQEINEQQKIELMSVLLDTVKFPMHINHDNTLGKAAIPNWKMIVEFYIKILSKKSYFLCKLAYNHVFEFRKLAWQLKEKQEIVVLAQEFLTLTDLFKDKLNKIKDFEIYNILLSRHGLDYNYIDDERWLDPLEINSQSNKIVDAQIQEYTKSINLENEVSWEKIIIYCIKNNGDPLLRSFFYQLGLDKPLFMIKLLNKYEAKLKGYFNSIFNGLLSSVEKERASHILREWINQDKYLESLIKIYWLDHFLLELIYKKAEEKKDFNLLNLILNNQYHEESNKSLILPIIDIFTKSETALNHNILYKLINVLDIQDLEKILNNLAYCKDLDRNYLYYIEEIAIKNPKIIIPFFEKIFSSTSESGYRNVISNFLNGHKIGEILISQQDNVANNFFHYLIAKQQQIYLVFYFAYKMKKYKMH